MYITGVNPAVLISKTRTHDVLSYCIASTPLLGKYVQHIHPWEAFHSVSWHDHESLQDNTGHSLSSLSQPGNETLPFGSFFLQGWQLQTSSS